MLPSRTDSAWYKLDETAFPPREDSPPPGRSADSMKEKIDRLALRARPPGSPIMRQNWDRLLFMHWPMEARRLRPLIPSALEIDTFEGQAWIGVTPFTVSGLRPVVGPGLPGLKSFHELNVRTYVLFHGRPGVWFFSLYASKTIPVLAARLAYALPYVKATIQVEWSRGSIDYRLQRRSEKQTEFSASWRPGAALRAPDTESLAFFLVERYCLYAASGSQLYQARVYHVPWSLQDVERFAGHSTVIAAQGLPEPAGDPLLYYADTLSVDIWAPEKI